jgi:hypothetical protein
MDLIVCACPHYYYLEAFKKTEVEAQSNNKVTIEGDMLRADIPDNLRNLLESFISLYFHFFKIIFRSG